MRRTICEPELFPFPISPKRQAQIQDIVKRLARFHPTKVFVDFNQNARDHTIACAYSVRGNPDGTVSAPIAWEEIDAVEPRELTIATMPDRFGAKGDLHAGIDERSFSLEPLLEWAERDG